MARHDVIVVGLRILDRILDRILRASHRTRQDGRPRNCGNQSALQHGLHPCLTTTSGLQLLLLPLPLRHLSLIFCPDPLVLGFAALFEILPLGQHLATCLFCCLTRLCLLRLFFVYGHCLCAILRVFCRSS
ncbi:unnamed protein product [Mycena citricolor]|uniref:Uncharacterized protein n=1 Tax=Mycena citricolor TaxID=2018698 RepID=A0AAD2K299_9AGAR|nr:unnamed protein product [Mycena citricolor]